MHVFEFTKKLDESGDTTLGAGERVRIAATIENPLAPGRYAIVCWVAVLRNNEETAQQAMKLLNFVVFGMARGQGIVSVPGELDVGLEREPAPERNA